MKSSRKTLHEFSSHIPQKTPKRKRSRSTNKMLHTDIAVRAQGTRESAAKLMNHWWRICAKRYLDKLLRNVTGGLFIIT
jgi:hypothetical protein